METDRTMWLKREVLASGRMAAADTHLNETDMVGLMGCLPPDPCKCEHLQDGIDVDDRASEYIAVNFHNRIQGPTIPSDVSNEKGAYWWPFTCSFNTYWIFNDF